jgi:hypothetical protein
MNADHLTMDELDSYHDQKLDAISRALADVHLKDCRICRESLSLFKK